MRMPKLARARISSLSALAVASALLVACAGESTGPSAPGVLPSQQQSHFGVVDANRALTGVSDGTYVISIDPKKDQRIGDDLNSLTIPANSVCEMNGSSGYGAAFWNQPCVAEKGRITITVTIRNAGSAHPGIEFSPALRFDPSKNVVLSIYAPNASLQDAQNLAMLYCADGGSCIDESSADPDLVTHVDMARNQVFRRIKHFSGYVVWSFAESAEEY
jgi:hypothetical protein